MFVGWIVFAILQDQITKQITKQHNHKDIDIDIDKGESDHAAATYHVFV